MKLCIQHRFFWKVYQTMEKISICVSLYHSFSVEPSESAMNYSDAVLYSKNFQEFKKWWMKANRRLQYPYNLDVVYKNLL